MKKAVLTKLTANYFMVSGKSGKCSVIFLKIVGRGGVGREGLSARPLISSAMRRQAIKKCNASRLQGLLPCVCKKFDFANYTCTLILQTQP